MVQLRLADAYRAGQKSAEADVHVRCALELAPGWLPAQTASMALAMREKQPAQARLLARAVQSQHPTEAVGFRLEGDIEGSQKNWDAAIAAFLKATMPIFFVTWPVPLCCATIGSWPKRANVKFSAPDRTMYRRSTTWPIC